MIDDPELMVIDIGSNIGLYSLFSSKLGRDVLSVEPFEDNIIRFHKAVKIQGLENRITLLNNVVYNKPGIIKKIYYHNGNYGNQMVEKQSDDKYKQADDKFLVKSIVLDDLIEYLPIDKKTNQIYKKAIMKIDIEGFEAIAFQSIKKLLKSIDIKVIFMEWVHVKRAIEGTFEDKCLIDMVDLLKSNGYQPFTVKNELLDFNKYKQWTHGDVCWRKEKK